MIQYNYYIYIKIIYIYNYTFIYINIACLLVELFNSRHIVYLLNEK